MSLLHQPNPLWVKADRKGLFALVCSAELKIPIKHFPADNTKLAEMEFYLLEDLDFHLIVFHPYRSLTAICGREPMDTGWFDPPGEDESETEINLGRGTGKAAIRFDKEIFETAWCVLRFFCCVSDRSCG